MDPDDDALRSFDCPRCAAPTEARFYGPCPPCRQALVAAVAGVALSDGAAEAARFEPAMHVVPNQVATKE
jgi:hypothetical protein